VREVLSSDHRAELDPEGLVAAGEEEPLAIARLVESVRRRVAVQGFATTGIVHDVARLKGEAGLEQRSLDALAPAGAFTHKEGGQHRLAPERSGVVIRDRSADVLRRAAEAPDRQGRRPAPDERGRAPPP